MHKNYFSENCFTSKLVISKTLFVADDFVTIELLDHTNVLDRWILSAVETSRFFLFTKNGIYWRRAPDSFRQLVWRHLSGEGYLPE